MTSFPPNILPKERHKVILDRLDEEKRVVSAELARDLRVTEDCIRRDLRDLAAQGLLKRVYGGALPVSPSSMAIFDRQTDNEVLSPLAERAASLVQNGQIVFFDTGTTALAIARAFSQDIRFTAVTLSPAIALALMEYPLVTVYLLGGRLNRFTGGVFSPNTIEEIRSIRADLCFIGACGIHPQSGVGAFDRDEAALKRALVEGSGEVIAVALEDKLGTAAPFLVIPLGDLSTLVVENKLQESAVAPYVAAGVSILRA